MTCCFSAPLHHHRLAARTLPALLAALCMSWGSTHAQTTAPAPTAKPLVSTTTRHAVREGDTLEQLAQRYLGERQQWPQIQSANGGVNPLRLVPGSVLEVPHRLLRASTASVEHVQGSASLSRSSGGSTGVQRGQVLKEGDRLQLSPDAFVTVRLADGSTVQVQSSSDLQLTQLRRKGRAGSLQSVLELQKGGVDIQVPGGAQPTRRLDVVTPVAATSVRGTHFDVQLAADGSSTASVLQGQVAVNTAETVDRSNAAADLRAGQGVAVTAQGQASAPRALLPAVPAQQLPQLAEDAQWLTLPLPAVPDVQAWRVAVAADAQGQQVLRWGEFAAQDTPRFAALDDGHYHLQVRPVDRDGISGYPTTAALKVKAHPVPPLAQSPAPGGLLATGEAQLQCTPVDGVARYRIQVIAVAADSTDVPDASAFAHPLVDAQDLRACELALAQLPAGHYAWRTASIRVLADGQDDAGPFSPAQRMRIAPRPAPLSADDVQEDSLHGVTRIHWAAEPGQRFRLQAFATPDGTTPALDTVLDAPTWTVAGLPAGTWHVRLQIQDPSGLHSAFSPPRAVRVLPLVTDGHGQPIGTGFGLGLEHPTGQP